MSKADGGAAFPLHSAPFSAQPGMTLRDWFAGQALAGLVQLDPTTAKQLSDPNDRRYEDWISADAYSLADAMLRTREASHER